MLAKKRAVVRVSRNDLLDMLKFKDEFTIANVATDEFGNLFISLEGDGLPDDCTNSQRGDPKRIYSMDELLNQGESI